MGHRDIPYLCPLDYLLAVEGALSAMRGAVSKALGSNARSFAAFPFVFEGTEPTTDKDNEVQGLASAFWLPIWSRPTTFGELHSFILDSQARLPRKECRFSSDFTRAIRSQGIDAGFSAFQEFRFKMRGAEIPWAVAGRYVACSGDRSDECSERVTGSCRRVWVSEPVRSSTKSERPTCIHFAPLFWKPSKTPPPSLTGRRSLMFCVAWQT